MFVWALIILFVAATTALQNPHAKVKRHIVHSRPQPTTRRGYSHTRTEFQYLNKRTRGFLVDGSSLPQVPFDIGESYAGTLANTPHGKSSLFFWFFPSANPEASNEITIWLNGGPGCSSLDGVLQENGPFLWQPGTYQPRPNPYSWTNLTNMVYVDQPAGTGLSPGPSTARNEFDVSNQFNDFWRRFIKTFGMEGYKIYITGESYAGQYIPYIAAGMLDEDDQTYFSLKGIQINDPAINEDHIMIEVPSAASLNYFSRLFSLNDTFMSYINDRADKCGYTKFLEDAIQYPPLENFPTVPRSDDAACTVWDDIVAAATFVNPCFSVYHLTDSCPFPWDELGFPSLAGGPNNYFNKSDVQRALHAPQTDFSLCHGGVFPHGDSSVPSALGPLPSVIERTNNVLIGHGWYDFLVFMNGSLVTIQNMTWNGARGFQSPPVEQLFVPYTDMLNQDAKGQPPVPYIWDAGAGILGTAHTERGLTFSTVYRSGHEIPQYAPGAAFRQLEFLLGRIDSLQQRGPFTTQRQNIDSDSAIHP